MGALTTTHRPNMIYFQPGDRGNTTKHDEKTDAGAGVASSSSSQLSVYIVLGITSGGVIFVIAAFIVAVILIRKRIAARYDVQTASELQWDPTGTSNKHVPGPVSANHNSSVHSDKHSTISHGRSLAIHSSWLPTSYTGENQGSTAGGDGGGGSGSGGNNDGGRAAGIELQWDTMDMYDDGDAVSAEIGRSEDVRIGGNIAATTDVGALAPASLLASKLRSRLSSTLSSWVQGNALQPDDDVGGDVRLASRLVSNRSCTITAEATLLEPHEELEPEYVTVSKVLRHSEEG